ncbi:MAG: hypothetical protein CMM30_04650 [Rhodospirillaceae bacterium]|nr:hypothetical protein [Rhodospirillaceae bacterium]
MLAIHASIIFMVAAIVGAFYVHEPDALANLDKTQLHSLKPGQPTTPDSSSFSAGDNYKYLTEGNNTQHHGGSLLARDLSLFYEFLENEGYKIAERKDYDDGDVLLKIKSRGRIVNFYIEQDNDLMFRAYYPIPSEFSEVNVNEWNKRYRWCKAYIDDDRDLVVELDVALSSKELSSQLTIESINKFFTVTEILSMWIVSGSNIPHSESVHNKSSDEESQI